MSEHLHLQIRLLLGTFHGKGDAGEVEWPPSPLRAFQALVAAAAARARPQSPAQSAGAALRWLESLPAPLIVTPTFHVGRPRRLAVPNNDLDVLMRAWSRGAEAKKGPAELKTLKQLRTLHLPDGDSVHYLWSLPAAPSSNERQFVSVLDEIAGSIVAFGLGLDVAMGTCSLLSSAEAESLEGERWPPHRAGSEGALRVPTTGTLVDLMARHQAFVDRLPADGSGFASPPPLSVFGRWKYSPAAASPPAPFAAFALLRPDRPGFRAWNASRRALTVAGMLRYATKLAAASSGWPTEKTNAFVLGHADSVPGQAHKPVGPRRFAFIPLPSIESRGIGRPIVVGSIRRVMLYCFDSDCGTEISWARRSVSGQELVDERSGEVVALLAPTSSQDGVLPRYTEPARVWATVTPVVLPGFDDPAHLRRRLRKGVPVAEQKQLLARLDERIDGLLRKALLQAGHAAVLVAQARLEWSQTGFLPGVEPAMLYGVPSQLRRFPRVHVRLEWRDRSGAALDIPGPLCFGGGRFYGLGVCVALPSGGRSFHPDGRPRTSLAPKAHAERPAVAAAPAPVPELHTRSLPGADRPPVDWAYEDGDS